MSEKENGEEKSVAECTEQTKDDVLEAIPDEVLREMPPEARTQLKNFIGMTSARYVGPAPNPLASKVTEEHITKLIDYSNKDDERKYEEFDKSRKFKLIIFFAVIIFLLVLILLFTFMKMTDILIPLIMSVLAFGGGWGLGKSS